MRLREEAWKKIKGNKDDGVCDTNGEGDMCPRIFPKIFLMRIFFITNAE